MLLSKVGPACSCIFSFACDLSQMRLRAGEVYGNSHGAAPGLNPKMGELLAAMQEHLTRQGSHAVHPQIPTLAGMPFTPSAGQKVVPQQQQQQHQQPQQQQQQQQLPQEQQQQQQQWLSNGIMATEQQQGQQQQQRHRQESRPEAMWPDPTTASVLQHLLQQSRPQRSWPPSGVHPLHLAKQPTYRLCKIVTFCYMLYLPIDVGLHIFWFVKPCCIFCFFVHSMQTLSRVSLLQGSDHHPGCSHDVRASHSQ